MPGLSKHSVRLSTLACQHWEQVGSVMTGYSRWGTVHFVPKATLYSDTSFKWWLSYKTISWTQKRDTKIDPVAVKKSLFLFTSLPCGLLPYEQITGWSLREPLLRAQGLDLGKGRTPAHHTAIFISERLWVRHWIGEMWALACLIRIDVGLLVLLSDYLHIFPLGCVWFAVCYVPNEEERKKSSTFFESYQLLKKISQFVS